MNINQFRQEYPQYNDMSDTQLSAALYSKHGQGQDIGQWNNQFLGKVEGDQSGSSMQSGLDVASGLGQKALQGVTFGFGDEISSGANAGIDWAANQLGLNDSPKSYDEWRSQAKSQLNDISEATPYTAGATELLGSFSVPGLGWAKGAKSVLGKIGLGAAEGAANAGLYATGTGEGDLTDRLANALGSASIGAGVGAGIPILGKALSSLKNLGKAEQLRAAGIGQRDISKGADDAISAFEREATGKYPVENAFDRLKSQGEFNPLKSGSTLDPTKLNTRSFENIRKLGKEVNDIIQPVSDQVGDVLPKRGYMTSVNKAIKDLKDNEQTDAIAYVNEYIRSMRKKGKVSLADLQKEKINIYNARYDTNSNAWKSQIDKAIASDFKKTIEKKVDFLASQNKLPKEMAGKVKKLNQQIGDWKKLQPVFSREEAKSWKGVAETILPAMRTSGGFGVPILAGLGATGGASLPLGIGAFMLAQNPSVRYGTGAALQGLGSAGEKLGNLDPSVMARLVEALQNQ